MRRLHVRGFNNVAKRVLLQAAAFNLALILRSITKAGTPRGLAERQLAALGLLLRFLAAWGRQEGDSGPESRIYFGGTAVHRKIALLNPQIRQNVGPSGNQGF
jgi:hypothetical protein